jgi:hypothetical protein
MGRDSVVGTVTRYRPDSLGIKTRCKRDFAHPFRQVQGAHPASYTMGAGSLLWVKRSESGEDHTSSSAEAEGRL